MSEKTGLHDFISFKKFISKTLIMIVYIIVAAWITISGIIYIIPKTERIPYLGDYTRTSNLHILIGIGIIIVGNLLWRIICEAGIVIFSIQDDLKKIEQHLDTQKKLTSTS
jgi:hypothetical protein